MAETKPITRGSTFGAIFLIATGGLFLYTNLVPGFDPWPWIARYWPALIILWGLYKLVNFFRFRTVPDPPPEARVTGGEIFGLVFLLVAGSLFSAAHRQVSGWPGDTRDWIRSDETVERGEAEAVDATLKMLSGDLFITGGSDKLLEANFAYADKDWQPRLRYSETGKRGTLKLTQPDRGTLHFPNDLNKWELYWNDQIPLSLNIEMGAGHAVLELGILPVSRLDFRMGAGQTEIDLRGDWKNDFKADIRGGVGHAIIRLPKDVGVRVRVRGALGTVQVDGLERRGGAYVNDLYRKSDVTLDIEVRGAIGVIEIEG